MKFSCNKTDLSEALLNTLKAVASNPSNPALGGVFLKTEENQLVLSGYDLQFGITTSIPATIDQQGSIVLPARLFSEIVREMDDDTVTIQVEKNLLTNIKYGLTNTTIIAIDPTEYPSFPQVNNDITLSISQPVLKGMIEQTLYAVSIDDQRPVHKGIKFELKDGVLTLISVDGSRLALCKQKVKSQENCEFVVPGRTMGDIAKLLKDGDTDICNIYKSEKHILFEIGHYRVFSRLLEGNFLDYNSAIPKSFTTTVVINTKDFTNSIKKASVIINDRFKEPIRICFEENNIVVLCKTPLGEVQDEIKAEKQGNDLVIGFNNKYLLDALKYTFCDKVKMSFGSEIAPMTITPLEGDDFLFLVLPVRIKNDI